MKFLASLANIVKIVFWYTQSFVLKAKSTLFNVNIPYFSHLNIAYNKKCSRISRLTQKISIFTLNQSAFWGIRLLQTPETHRSWETSTLKIVFQ